MRKRQGRGRVHLAIAFLIAAAIAGYCRAGTEIRLERYRVDDDAPANLTHLSIRIPPPRDAWFVAYESVRQVRYLNDLLDDELIPALEAEGDPAGRLQRFSEIVTDAQQHMTETGSRVDDSYSGLLPMASDLKVLFYFTLAGRIASTDYRIKAERRRALQKLLKMVESPEPAGFPEPDDGLPWTVNAEDEARSAIQMYIDALKQDWP